MAAAVLLVAGCGSGGAAGGSSGGANAEPIVIGSLAAYTGGTVDLNGVKKTLEAWGKSVNDAGGINGHPVKFVIKDTAGTPSNSLRAVQQLVEEDKAVAIVGQWDANFTTWASYVEKAGIPVIGGNPITTPLNNPTFFPVGGNVPGLQYGVAKEAAARNGKVAFIYCAEVPACKESVKSLEAVAPVAGAQLVASAPAAKSATDYTSVCETIKNSGASVYEMGVSGALAIRIAAACQRIGLTAQPVFIAGVSVESHATQPALQSLIEVDTNAPWFDKSLPGMKAFHEAVDKYAPLQGDENFPGAVGAWASAQLFQKAASLVQGPVTPDSIKKALYSLKDETLGGISPPLNYTEGKPSFFSCFFAYGVSNGTWTATEGLTPKCLPADVATQLQKSMAG
ncbi:hypothetical protein GCM10009836_61030 [Pseudonocardia ailaonensis]|uniref:Leucine-binding protein domain-containing protein n=1 Tax=Pseudonocardia ailaonensis TaxID=367279 RepID=A0ABN2NK23_9PSEU